MTPFVCGWGGVMRALVAMTVRCVGDRNGLGAEDGRHVLWWACRATAVGGGDVVVVEVSRVRRWVVELCCALVVVWSRLPAVAPSLES